MAKREDPGPVPARARGMGARSTSNLAKTLSGGLREKLRRQMQPTDSEATVVMQPEADSSFFEGSASLDESWHQTFHDQLRPSASEETVVLQPIQPEDITPEPLLVPKAWSEVVLQQCSPSLQLGLEARSLSDSLLECRPALQRMPSYDEVEPEKVRYIAKACSEVQMVPRAPSTPALPAGRPFGTSNSDSLLAYRPFMEQVMLAQQQAQAQQAQQAQAQLPGGLRHQKVRTPLADLSFTKDYEGKIVMVLDEGLLVDIHAETWGLLPWSPALSEIPRELLEKDCPLANLLVRQVDASKDILVLQLEGVGHEGETLAEETLLEIYSRVLEWAKQPAEPQPVSTESRWRSP